MPIGDAGGRLAVAYLVSVRVSARVRVRVIFRVRVRVDVGDTNPNPP